MKITRVTLTLLASLSLIALGACGEDDETADGDDTTTTAIEEPGAEVDQDGEGEDGPPEANPCAEGESGTFGPPPEEPADDATSVTITATDYEFAGWEELHNAGEYGITLVNEGEELHEMQLVRITDEQNRPIEELVDLNEEELEGVINQVAFSFACPGDAADPVAADMTEPGRYVMICFIPVGATPETSIEEFETLEPPHFAQGMVHEFEVT
jgi:hypothetical protein